MPAGEVPSAPPAAALPADGSSPPEPIVAPAAPAAAPPAGPTAADIERYNALTATAAGLWGGLAAAGVAVARARNPRACRRQRCQVGRSQVAGALPRLPRLLALISALFVVVVVGALGGGVVEACGGEEEGGGRVAAVAVVVQLIHGG